MASAYRLNRTLNAAWSPAENLVTSSESLTVTSGGCLATVSSLGLASTTMVSLAPLKRKAGLALAYPIAICPDRAGQFPHARSVPGGLRNSGPNVELGWGHPTLGLDRVWGSRSWDTRLPGANRIRRSAASRRRPARPMQAPSFACASHRVSVLGTSISRLETVPSGSPSITAISASVYPSRASETSRGDPTRVTHRRHLAPDAQALCGAPLNDLPGGGGHVPHLSPASTNGENGCFLDRRPTAGTEPASASRQLTRG
jgi:hypothetical protein